MIINPAAKRTFLLLAIVATSSVDSFLPKSRVGTLRSSVKPFHAATLEPTATTPAPTTWECDEDASCVEVPACDDEGCRTSLDVRIHGEWYDLTG